MSLTTSLHEQRRTLCAQLAIDATVDTATAAQLLNVAPQTLRRWGCYGKGPIKPRRLGCRLRWALTDIRKLLGD